MSEYRDTLERELDRLRPPRIPFDQLEARRDRKRREQRVRAGVLGLAIAIAVGWWGFHAIRSTDPRPADDTRPNPTPELRHDGENIAFEQLGPGPGWDLAAQDPETGRLRELADTEGIVDCPNRPHCNNFVTQAEWSADGEWVAFDVFFDGPCGPTAGIWVVGAAGDPRQLTTPCTSATGSDRLIEEVWAWSPVGARLAYARVDSETQEMFVINPFDGHRTSLGTVGGGLSDDGVWKTSTLEWSPDGTRIAYADGESIYSVEVDGGERSLLADSFIDVIDLVWSPDGTHILVQDKDRSRLQVMNADGSDVHVVLDSEDDACCETEWSANGDRIVYQLSVVPAGDRFGFAFDSEVWTVSPDGSNRIKVFDSDGCDMGDIADALPVWAPNGDQVAYNACGVWVVANADGTGDAQPIDELVHRSWDGGGLFTGYGVH